VNNRKYEYSKIEAAITDLWLTNHYPPTLRQIMKVAKISSTSVCKYIIEHLDNVRTVDGHVIPRWVDKVLLQQAKEEIT
jgi:hypothetical protein